MSSKTKEVYVVRGLTGVIGGTDGDAIAAIWNLSSTRRIEVVEAFAFRADSAGNFARPYLVRSTARGTAGSTVTPDSDNASRSDSAPPSGFVLDLGPFSVQPTKAIPTMMSGSVWHTAEGSGFYLPIPRAIVLPPGTGLVIAKEGTGADTMVACEAGFAVED